MQLTLLSWQEKVAKEISALKPFDSKPTKIPVTFEQKLKGMLDNLDIEGYSELIERKKDIYQDNRTP